MPLDVPASFRWAVDNIATWGDTDVFPLPPENHVFHDMPDECVAELLKVHSSLEDALAANPPVNQSALAPVGYVGFRWATEIDPLWNAYLLGLVLRISKEIEEARVSPDEGVVFSYYLGEHPDGSDIFRKNEWAAFQDANSEKASNCEYVVQTDIADFYARVYHHPLENALRRLNLAGDEPNRIMKLVSAIAGVASYGLPVGGPAARLLSELVLASVDQLLLLEGIRFSRFSDDFVLFVDSREHAYRTLALLSEKLQRTGGLSLQKLKTRILTSKEYLETAEFAVQNEEEEAQAQPFLRISLRFDPYSPTAVEDYAVLQAEVQKYDVNGMLTRELAKSRVRPAFFRRLLRALQFMTPSSRDAAAMSLADNFDSLTPLLPDVMRALRQVIPMLGSAGSEYVRGKLVDMIQGGSHLLAIDLNVAYVLRVLAMFEPDGLPELVAKIYSKTSAAFVRHDALLIMALWKEIAFVSDKKAIYPQMDPWEKRAF